MIDVSGEAVRKAIASGRLVDSVIRDEKGRPSLDPDIALVEWKKHTNQGRGSASRGEGARIPKAQPAGPKTAASAPSPLEQATRAYLERNGVDPAAVTIVGASKGRPIAPPDVGDPGPRDARAMRARDLAPDPDDDQDSVDPDGTPNLNVSRAWKEHYQREIARVTLEEKLGTLINADEAAERWSALIASCKTKLMGIPSKARSRLPKLDNADVALLEKLVREALEELAQ